MPPAPLVQIQNNCTEMFLMIPKNWSECLAQLNNMATRAKIEISLNDISLATGQYIIYSCARIRVSDPGP